MEYSLTNLFYINYCYGIFQFNSILSLFCICDIWTLQPMINSFVVWHLVFWYQVTLIMFGWKLGDDTVTTLPEPSSLRGSTLGTRATEHKGCNWTCKLIDGFSLELWSATPSVSSVVVGKCCVTYLVVLSGICHGNKVNSTSWLYRDGLAMRYILHDLCMCSYNVSPECI